MILRPFHVPTMVSDTTAVAVATDVPVGPHHGAGIGAM
jgi:hypothetical protein